MVKKFIKIIKIILLFPYNIYKTRVLLIEQIYANDQKFISIHNQLAEQLCRLKDLQTETRTALHKLDANKINIDKILASDKTQLTYNEATNRLILSLYLSQEIGITTEKRNQKLIVSLTSYAHRVDTVYLTILSIFEQSIKADKVVLYLNEDDYNMETIPISLKMLISRGLEIVFCRDIKSYKKLIYSLKSFPNDLIVTADDDAIYPNNWLRELYEAYLSEPQYIHCHKIHYIGLNNDGTMLPYKEWDLTSKAPMPSFRALPVGIGGVLYFPGSLNAEVFNENVFMSICPTADDVWFKAMSLLNNVKCKRVNSETTEDLRLIPGTQEIGLYHINYHKSKNDGQLDAVFHRYNLLPVVAKFDSKRFWEYLYSQGGNSGPGSYNEKAKYKAKILNDICAEFSIKSLLEFGSGDGNNLSYYTIENYCGLDVSETAVDLCKNKYKDDPKKTFIHYNPNYFKPEDFMTELTISFEVIFHLIEDNVFEKYIYNLFMSSKKYVLIFSSNDNDMTDPAEHVKHRKFTDYIPNNFKLIRKIETPKSGVLKEFFSDFYLFKKIESK